MCRHLSLPQLPSLGSTALAHTLPLHRVLGCRDWEPIASQENFQRPREGAPQAGRCVGHEAITDRSITMTAAVPRPV